MPLEIKSKRIIYEGKFLTVWETTFFDKNGNEQKWEWIEKRNSVFIFPITPQQNIILVKNFRVPLEKYVIEMPAGVKEKGESDEETAKRELLEETGYQAKKLIFVTNPWPYRSGSSSAKSKGFIATELIKEKDATGDETEDLSTIEVKMDQLMDFYFCLKNDVLFDISILAMHSIALHKGIRG